MLDKCLGKTTVLNNCTRNAYFVSVNNENVIFGYDVALGDVVSKLNIINTTAVVLEKASIRTYSSYPTTDVDLSLPYGDNIGLAASGIQISALNNPRLVAITTNRSPGIYGAGEEIIITLTFSDPIYIIYRTYILYTITIPLYFRSLTLANLFL
jgi:hypothetical protein